MTDDKPIAAILDDQVEATVAPDGTVTVKLTADDQAIRDIEFAETMIEFANYEALWRSYADDRSKDRSIAAEEKLSKMFMQGWDDRKQAAEAYKRFRLLLLYMRRVGPRF
jgi:hypothetical protein